MSASATQPGVPRSRAELLEALRQIAGNEKRNSQTLFGLADEIGQVILTEIRPPIDSEVVFGKISIATTKELLALLNASDDLKASQFGSARCCLIDALTPGEAPGCLSAETLQKLNAIRAAGYVGLAKEYGRLWVALNVNKSNIETCASRPVPPRTRAWV